MTGICIAGITPVTTIDFPGRLAAVLWCRGCNLRCSYCHNDDLRSVGPSPYDRNWQSVKTFLSRRRDWLDAVVFSGGEPLVQGALTEAVDEVREMGFEAGLHTAGSSPGRFERVLGHLDWVGFDVKAPFDEYDRVTGVPGSGRKSKTSLEMLVSAGVPFEVRTTASPDLIPADRLVEMCRELAEMGVRTYRLQEISPVRTRYSEDLEEELRAIFEDFDVRRAVLQCDPGLAA